MTYNIDFLIAAMVILLLVLWYFLGQKRAEDLNNQVFLSFDVFIRCADIHSDGDDSDKPVHRKAVLF